MLPDFQLSSYHYELPAHLIAQEPPEQRGQSRLLVLERDMGVVRHAHFAELAQYLPPKSLLVVNNSRVVPARLLGNRPTGGKMELLILTPPVLLQKQAQELCSEHFAKLFTRQKYASKGFCEAGKQVLRESEKLSDLGHSCVCNGPNSFSTKESWLYAEAEVLLKPAKSMSDGQVLTFGENFKALVLEKRDFGKHLVQLVWKGSLLALLEKQGEIPLPPYIRRQENEYKHDVERYQTLYANREQCGSVAAPTAGLHFNQNIQAELASHGFGWAEVTLHVGYGTFSPVRDDDLRQHQMHGEYVELSAEVAQLVLQAKASGRPIVAVGTTAARTLEGVFQACGEIPSQGFSGYISIFIYPGYVFGVIDHLITNFHLPESTLLMLVSALAGRENVFEAYRQAVDKEYRFFSYGDAMLIR